LQFRKKHTSGKDGAKDEGKWGRASERSIKRGKSGAALTGKYFTKPKEPRKETGGGGGGGSARGGVRYE